MLRRGDDEPHEWGNAKVTPEGYVKKAVEDLLKAERIRYWRMNAGDRFGSTNGRKWRIRGHEAGTPDFLASLKREIACPRCSDPVAQLMWIEVKAPGESPTKQQLAFADEARNNHEGWLCIDDVKELQEWLRENRAR